MIEIHHDSMAVGYNVIAVARQRTLVFNRGKQDPSNVRGVGQLYLTFIKYPVLAQRPSLP